MLGALQLEVHLFVGFERGPLDDTLQQCIAAH